MSLTPAALGESPTGHAQGVPYSPLYDDVYHAAAGAWAQARHVFLGGNGLPGRWQGRRRFVILETGFGLGNNFLATWAVWRRDAARCDHLVFISIEKHPLLRKDLARVHGLLAPIATDARNEVDGGIAPDVRQADEQGADEAVRRELAQRLVDAWPTLTPGLHTLHFHDDALSAVPSANDEAAPDSTQLNRPSVTLLLGLGDIAKLLPALVAHVDAFYLDGFAPAKNPQMWDEGLLARLNRLAAPGATAATWSAARGVRDALASAGFQVERVPGFAGKRDMVRAVYAPRYQAPWPVGGCWPEPDEAADRHAIVLGAGLAGCSAALALCREGWRVTLVDRQAGPAAEASGNPGGLFHSVLHGEDGVHARTHRAAALACWRHAAAAIAAGRLQGDARGLLRLDPKTDAGAARALLAALGLPPDHVEWLDLDAAHAQAGMAVPSGGWLFHQGGWLHPAGLAATMLAEAASLMREGRPLLQCLWHREARGIDVADDGTWQLWDRTGVIAQAPSLVLCNAMGVGPLLETLPGSHAVADLPLSAVRGQITQWSLPSPVAGGVEAGVSVPRLPVAGAGYVLPLSENTLLCGATTQHHDADPAVRDADHRHNLAQAARLGACPPWPAEAPLPAGLQGRTAWRATTPDRLPLVGALPPSAQRLASQASKHGRAQRLDQVRLIPRERSRRGGLYVLAGLGSRGITWSCLAGELLAHWVTGTPCPVEADLRDAVDPARFLARHTARHPSRYSGHPTSLASHASHDGLAPKDPSKG